MHEDQWEMIQAVYGELQAELLRGFLEAQDIPVMLIQEGAGRAYGINVGPLGEVQILVPSRFSRIARQVLSDYYAGKYETEGEDEEEE